MQQFDHLNLLNFLDGNINKLFDRILEAGMNTADFGEGTERWGGENHVMREDQRTAKVIFWKKNPNYKFVWHLFDNRTQTIFFPAGNHKYKYRDNYPDAIKFHASIAPGVANEFARWLPLLKMQLDEEEKAKIRQQLSQEQSHEMNSKVASPIEKPETKTHVSKKIDKPIANDDDDDKEFITWDVS